jgi:23S rRNA pseudouridine1911/1915/1917 synthase
MYYNKPFIIFENDYFCIVYKPPYYKVDTDGNYKHINSYDDYKKNKINSLHVYMKLYFKLNKIYLNEPEYGAVHRYDKQTSGGLIFVKDNNIFNDFRKIISNKSITTKIYITLVNGIFEKKYGYIDKKIKTTVENNISTSFISDDGKDAYSYYQVIGEYKDKYSLVHVKIFTGRTHQIRIHMNYLGHPIVSDFKYITDDKLLKKNKKIIDRFFLHNIYLQFYYKNEKYKFIIPLSCDLYNCLNKLQNFKYYSDIYNFNKTLLKSKIN